MPSESSSGRPMAKRATHSGQARIRQSAPADGCIPRKCRRSARPTESELVGPSDRMRLILAIGAFALVSLGVGTASAAPALPFVLKQVGPGVYAAIDGPEHKAGSNAGFVIGDDGVLVIDALFTEDAGRALVGEIRRLTPKPIRYVVNTHYHADHTG